MKKLLALCLLSGNLYAAQPSDKDVDRPFLSNGGFKGLCANLGWDWGNLNDDFSQSKGCFSKTYAYRNNYTLVDGTWIKSDS